LAPETSLLSVEGLGVSYGRTRAVDGVSLTVAPGSIVTLIGANGAGKTSTLNALMGLLSATGRLVLDGEDITASGLDERVAMGLALVPESRDLFGGMSVEDNLILGGYRSRSRRAIQHGLEANYARFPRLKERRTQLAGTLSGGERQMLAMARCLMVTPRVLMLDEPSLGLAPKVVEEVLRLVAELKRDGMAVVLVEQNARAALQIADRAYVMELGQIRQEGDARAMLSDPRIVDLYLGGQVQPA